MPWYVCLIQFKDQGIRNIQDTVKRADAAMAEAKKMGMKIVEASDDETMSAFMLKIVHLVTSKPKPCARFAEARWKRAWRN